MSEFKMLPLHGVPPLVIPASTLRELGVEQLPVGIGIRFDWEAVRWEIQLPGQDEWKKV